MMQTIDIPSWCETRAHLSNTANDMGMSYMAKQGANESAALILA